MKSLLKQYQRHSKDSGSSEVQLIQLTYRISTIQSHLAKFRKDKHSLRGLLKMINRRRKILTYLNRNDKNDSLPSLRKDLGIRSNQFKI